MSADIVVSVQGLRRVYADFWGRPKVVAVDDLNFEIPRGEVFGLLGPNGSGKSTTVRMLLDLLRPTKGRISIMGGPPSQLKTKERIGYLPEETPLYPFLNAEETLDFFGRLFDLPAGVRRERIGQLVDMVGLGPARRRAAGEYSKGMQRRLGLAQALLNDPDLVILDEPTTGLDPLGIREFRDLIRSLAARGKTVLLTSHILADVEDVCDRVLILFAGRTIAGGRLDELLADPTSARVTVPAEALEAVRSAVGSGGMTVEPSRRSLESFFIDIIGRARAAADTPEQKVADYLAAPAAVEESLADLAPAVPAAEPPAAPEPAADLTEAEESLRAAFGDDRPDA